MKRGICTIVSLNYFAQAVSLMKNVKKFHPEAELHVLLVDRVQSAEVTEKLKEYEGVAKLYTVEEIGIPDMISMAFKYDVVELNTAVKPFFMEFLLSEYQYDNLIYIDADILLFHKMDRIYEELEKHSVILTPHLISVEEDVDTRISKTQDFLRYGIYNLGFIAVRNNEAGREAVRWWKHKLHEKCYLSKEEFLAWDQKWMDFAPALLDDVYILRDKGHNVAFWNIQGRVISEKDGEYFVNDTVPLVFYHFSHYRLVNRDKIANVEQKTRRISLSERKDLEPLFDIYYQSVMENDFDFFSKIPYGYKFYDDGEVISKEDRDAYKKLLENGKVGKENPFAIAI